MPRSWSALGSCLVRRKCLVLATAVIALLVGVGGYAYWSAAVWQQVADSSRQASQETRVSVRQLGVQKVSRSHLVQQAEVMTGRIDTMCDIPAIIAWQPYVLQYVQDVGDDCSKTREKLTDVRSALGEIAARAASEQEFARTLDTVRISLEKLPQGDYMARRNVWDVCRVSIEQLRAHDSLRETKQVARDAAKGITTAYDALIAANKAQQRTEFDAAIAEVEKGYFQLGAVEKGATGSYCGIGLARVAPSDGYLPFLLLTNRCKGRIVYIIFLKINKGYEKWQIARYLGDQ